MEGNCVLERTDLLYIPIIHIGESHAKESTKDTVNKWFVFQSS